MSTNRITIMQEKVKYMLDQTSIFEIILINLLKRRTK